MTVGQQSRKIGVMDDPWLIALAALGLAALVVAAFIVPKRIRQRRRRRARAEFPELRPDVERQFFAAASASGKPRGLRWKEIRFHEGQSFAVDRVSGALYALVGATVSFEAIEGGPMEDVEAVGNLRAATAVFVFNKGTWTAEGRTIFNLTPQETIDRYQSALKPVE